MAIESINPFTNQVVKTFSEDSEEKIEQVLELAGTTFSFWKDTPFSHRAQLMRKTAEILVQHTTTYARLMTEEMGKPLKMPLRK